MKTVVLGLGISGRAAVKFLKARGDEVVGVDRSLPQIEGITVVSDSAPPSLQGVELLVKSPGIVRTHPWVQAALAHHIPVIGEIDLALAELARRGKRVLGVTGSNGKTTTTMMAAHFLNTQGTRAIAAGNIGVPLLEQIDADYSVYVVELSSFQLEHLVPCQVLDAAVVLNITPNHLDRHPSFEHYVQSKLNIASCLKEGAALWVTEKVVEFCRELRVKVVETISSLSYRHSRFQLFPHDVENAAAALALTEVPLAILEEGIETFVRPAHRLEFVGETGGVKYINDSKATSVDAVIKALQAIEKPIVLIVGGVDKGGAYTDWLPHMRGKVHRVIALGEASKRIAMELGKEMNVQAVASLQEGVNCAQKCSRPGDVVLLSPGCSSYDQFKDYQHRGETFRQLVREII